MENWVDVFYNGIETNLQVTKCGRVRRVIKDWYKRVNNIGEINYKDFKRTREGYIKISVSIKDLGCKSRYLHQLVASAFLNYEFNGTDLVVHHKSTPLCNCLLNLEIITRRQNASIERTEKSGLPVGVSFKKQQKKFQAGIRINGKKLFLGYFNNVEDASKAYQDKLKELIELGGS